MSGNGAGPSQDPEAELLRALRSAVEATVEREPMVAILFSGGLDSTLLAWLLPPGVEAKLVAVGTSDAADLIAARDAAAQIHRPVDLHRLSRDEVLDAWTKWAGELGALREPGRSVGLALALATAAAPPGPVLCGQGADELFYGYAHFRSLGDEAARRRSTEDLERLETSDWPRALRIGRTLGRELRAPYLDPGVRAAARRFPPPGPSDPPKFALRHAAARAGLPAALVDRPKRALQYGSGVAKLLARSVREPPAPLG
ncbi:MAG TPA: asparagine synthase-related protein [Acidimicrobiales bacterium]|nr:asparagine synthase-related protein [Acidimicrobiales bacterium]